MSFRLINEVDTDVLKLKQVTALEQLEFVIHRLMDDVIKPRHFPLTPKSVKKLLSDSRGMKSAHDESTSVLYDVNKFSLEIRPSVLTGGGNGVFVSRGCVKGEQLVALYPGGSVKHLSKLYFLFSCLLFSPKEHSIYHISQS